VATAMAGKLHTVRQLRHGISSLLIVR
jgi:hypothetical protein